MGDNIGVSMLGLYGCACTNPAYARELGIAPPAGFLPRALGLNCGLYRFTHGECAFFRR